MIHVVLCSDNNYAMPAGVMMYSVCIHTGSVMFHVILSKDFSKSNRRKLECIAEPFGAKINFITIPDCITEDFPVKMNGQAGHITAASYYRLFLTRLLPDCVHRAIYLDCDLICLQSLNGLWGINMDNAPLACVKDVPYDGICEAKRLGYDERLGYFNAGVLLINLDYWREHNVLDEFSEMLSLRPEILKSHDQDILNYVFRGQAMFLPPKYNAVDLLFYKGGGNFPYSDRETYEAIHSPVIVHFTYIKKPWIKGYGHTYEKVFLDYKKRTPWKYNMRKIAKADNLKGFISNIFVFFGFHTYSNNYIRLSNF